MLKFVHFPTSILPPPAYRSARNVDQDVSKEKNVLSEKILSLDDNYLAKSQRVGLAFSLSFVANESLVLF